MSDPSDPTDPSDEEPKSASNRRVIKRYSNRKLYDTRESRYVTLLEIAEFVRAGQDVQVVDNATKEDKTDVTLALIISEELKARPKGIPLNTLRSLILEHGERLLNQLREVPIKKLVTWDSDTSSSAAAGSDHDSPEAGQAPVEAPKKSSPFDAIPSASNTARSIRATLEQWQQAIDERIRAVVPNFSAISELEREVKQLKERFTAIEARVGQKAANPDPPVNQGSTNSQE
jgi:polyhydroxyalkanoate synthesis repressor PhaR